MKHVQAIEILGNPKQVDRQAACPHCSARSTVFEDGSIICVVEAKCFAPEPRDAELFKMRREFDTRNGITAADRLITPRALAAGLKPNMPALHER
jgi:hypothetical protein